MRRWLTVSPDKMAIPGSLFLSHFNEYFGASNNFLTDLLAPYLSTTRRPKVTEPTTVDVASNRLRNASAEHVHSVFPHNIRQAVGRNADANMSGIYLTSKGADRFVHDTIIGTLADIVEDAGLSPLLELRHMFSTSLTDEGDGREGSTIYQPDMHLYVPIVDKRDDQFWTLTGARTSTVVEVKYLSSTGIVAYQNFDSRNAGPNGSVNLHLTNYQAKFKQAQDEGHSCYVTDILTDSLRPIDPLTALGQHEMMIVTIGPLSDCSKTLSKLLRRVADYKACTYGLADGFQTHRLASVQYRQEYEARVSQQFS